MTITRNSTVKTRNRRQAGFTLIEMVVVVAIIAMLAMLVFPRLPSMGATNLRDSARNLAAAIRYLGDKAITTKGAYRLKIDLTGDTLVVRKVENGEEGADSDPFFSRRLLADGIDVEDVRIPRLGKLSAGEVSVSFGPAGLEDFVTIHLKGNQGGHYTVVAYPQNGKVKVSEGYQEVEQ